MLFFLAPPLLLLGQTRFGYDIEWTEGIGMGISNNDLIKTGAAGWNASATSENVLLADTDGWLEVSVEQTNASRMFGLAIPNEVASYVSITYAMYLVSNGTIHVYEKGGSKGAKGVYKKGDVLSVEREGETIYYKQNGNTIYTSLTPSTEEMIADVSFHETKGTLYNARASFAVAPPEFKSTRFGYDIEWTEGVGMGISNNDLIKTGAAGWNASATSENVLLADTDGWLEVSVEQTNASRMFGLAIPNEVASYVSITYAMYLVSNGTIHVYEKGGSKGAKGVYKKGDVLSVEREGETIYYKQNGNTIYTSLTPSTEEMIADVSFHETKGTLYNARASFAVAPPEFKSTRFGYNIEWAEGIGMGISNNDLIKTGAAGWNASATSENVLLADTDGWLEVSVEQTNASRMFGLAIPNEVASYVSITYAMYLVSNGTIHVYEKGGSKGAKGVYKKGDVLSVEREGETIYYKQNGNTIYTSLTPSTEEMIADVSFHETKGTLYNARASFAVAPPEFKSTRFGYDIEWTEGIGMGISNNDLIKTGAAGWNASATSENVLLADTDGWLEVSVEQTNTSRMFGLAIPNEVASYVSITYAMYLVSNGTIHVYEKGGSKGAKGVYKKGDVLSVEREGETIYYKQNGNTIYTSLTPSTEEMIADVSFHETKGTLYNARASFAVAPPEFKSTRFGYDIEWTEGVGMGISNNDLIKTGAAGWNASATSENVLLADTDGWLEVSVEQTNTSRMFGLAIPNEVASYVSITYAMYLVSNGTIHVYEKGGSKGAKGVYKKGDVLSVEREGETIYYKQNGNTIYTSLTPSTEEMIADVSFHETKGTLYNARASFAVAPPEFKSTRFGYDIEWTEGIGMGISNNDLIKTGAAGWNASATSENVLLADTDGWLEVSVEQTNTSRMFGLAIPNEVASYVSITYAMYLVSNGTIHVYEKGGSKGAKGVYKKGDVLSVEREGETIYYKQNGNTIYTSLTPSTEEMIADVSFHEPKGTLYNARASFAVALKETNEGIAGGFLFLTITKKTPI